VVDAPVVGDAPVVVDVPVVADSLVDTASDAGPLLARRLSLAATSFMTNTYGEIGTSAAAVTDCPGSQVLIGVHVSYNDNQLFVVGLEAACGLATVTAGQPYVITFPTLTTQPGYGGNGSNRVLVRCPPNQAAVGFYGKSGGLLDQLGLACAPLTAGADARTITTGPKTSVGPFPAGASGAPFMEDCPSGLVARGYVINFGAWIDALTLRCARPSLVATP
jgi:hypothetical protein